MTSVVGICNLALTKLGAARITSLTDDTKQARALNAIYEATRDAELAAQPWSFATKRAQIPASSTAPDFGWDYSYPAPSDYLAMVEVGEDFTFYASDQGALFQLESDPATGAMAILSNESSPLNIRYVYRVTNAGLFPPLFVQALACRLAAEVAEELTQSIDKRTAAWKERTQAVRDAKRANAIEQPPRRPPDSSWVRALDQLSG